MQNIAFLNIMDMTIDVFTGVIALITTCVSPLFRYCLILCTVLSVLPVHAQSSTYTLAWESDLDKNSKVKSFLSERWEQVSSGEGWNTQQYCGAPLGVLQCASVRNRGGCTVPIQTAAVTMSWVPFKVDVQELDRLYRPTNQLRTCAWCRSGSRMCMTPMFRAYEKQCTCSNCVDARGTVQMTAIDFNYDDCDCWFSYTCDCVDLPPNPLEFIEVGPAQVRTNHDFACGVNDYFLDGVMDVLPITAIAQSASDLNFGQEISEALICDPDMGPYVKGLKKCEYFKRTVNPHKVESYDYEKATPVQRAVEGKCALDPPKPQDRECQKTEYQIGGNLNAVLITSAAVGDRAYGVASQCLINNMSLTTPLCGVENNLFNRCFRVKELMTEAIVDGLNIDVQRDILTHQIYSDAAYRRAFAVTIPELPYNAGKAASIMNVYSDENCIDEFLVRQRVVGLSPNVHFVGLHNKRKSGQEPLPDAALIDRIVDSINDVEIEGEMSFRILPPEGYQCECPPGHSADMSPILAQRTGLHSCTQCGAGQIAQSTGVHCGNEIRICVSCERGLFPDVNQSECLTCNYRAYEVPVLQADGTYACLTCDEHQYWTWPLNENFPRCEALQRMAVTHDDSSPCTPKLDPAFDMYVQDRAGALDVTHPVPDGSFVDISTNEIKSCAAEPELPQGWFRSLCGVPKIGLWVWNDQWYVVYSNTWQEYDANHNLQSITISGSCTSSSPLYVSRSGLIQPCTQCANEHYLSTPCTSAGAGHAGLCSPCKTSTTGCAAGKTCYLWHENGASGCQFPNDEGLLVTSDYEVRECVNVIKEPTESNTPVRVWLAVGCGGQNTFKFGVSEVVPASGGNAATLQVVDRTCDFTSDTNCLYKNNNLETGTIYDAFSQLIPYCPENFYVDEGCLAVHGDNFHRDCCKYCESCDVTQVRKDIWQVCSGSTTTNTESMCADGCDVNYYRDKSSSDNSFAGECKLCEQCSQGDLI